MQIGSVGFRPYIYNTNTVSPSSMNKIAAIGKDALASKTDVSALTSDEAKKSETTNPLKRGESLDFAGIIQMQMQMSRMNADRLMKPQDEQAQADATQKITPVTEQTADAYAAQQNASAVTGFDWLYSLYILYINYRYVDFIKMSQRTCFYTK